MKYNSVTFGYFVGQASHTYPHQCGFPAIGRPLCESKASLLPSHIPRGCAWMQNTARGRPSSASPRGCRTPPSPSSPCENRGNQGTLRTRMFYRPHRVVFLFLSHSTLVAFSPGSDCKIKVKKHISLSLQICLLMLVLIQKIS